ncbi:MAG: DUF2442 domain-containing protein [Chitinophagaceae bacterium]|jgi:hypothetical protein|nr:DUF2442 domain-containing protein [Chitinophagaceae bacterium]
MITKNEIKKIGFTKTEIYLELRTGERKYLSLEDFPRLKNATGEQRKNYRLSHFGAHWDEIDEDLSFNGFFSYKKFSQNEVALFFQNFPEISLGKFAERIGISPAMLRHYVCGTKNPGENRKKEIEKELHKLGDELLSVAF